MKLDQIEQLIKLVKENDVKNFKYKDHSSEVEIDFTSPQQTTGTQYATIANEANDNTQAATQNNSTASQTIIAPMVGTFFLQDEKELTNPLIQVGHEVKKGDVVGYIEAMKVLNEVTSEVEGKISEITVEHGDNVEYNQVIIKVD